LQYHLGKFYFNSGIIINFKDDYLIHSASTLPSSSGFPLIKRYNLNFIIGIHRGQVKVTISGKKDMYNVAISYDDILKDLKDQIFYFK